MLSFFLRIMRQRSGGSSFVCVQLLQTLNILFENIRNETSLCKFFSRENRYFCNTKPCLLGLNTCFIHINM